MAELLVERRASVSSVSTVGPQSRRGSVSADGGASSDRGWRGTMEVLPEELRRMVVERISLVEDRLNLRLVSIVWRGSVDRFSKRYWLQLLPAGEQFAATFDAGLHTVQQHANGMGYFVHTFNSSLHLALYPSLDIS
jgi:hypothetical protein